MRYLIKLQLGRFEMRDFGTDCFSKETNKKHLANLQLGRFETKNFVADCFYKEINNITCY